jgi:hypothetical protein
MPDRPQIMSVPQGNNQFEEWIDQRVSEGHNALEVASGIASVTQPGGTAGYEISPEMFGNEAWFWPWNRAGFLYLKRSKPIDAATIFICAYLAAIRFQHVWQYRIQKGMPLCNVAYAFLSAGKPDRAGVPALLGMVEDAITAGNPTETPSFQNLLAANASQIVARSLADTFVFLTRRRGLSPLYPETVLDSVSRGGAHPSRDFVVDMQTISVEFSPDTVQPALERLIGVWNQLQPVFAETITPRGGDYGESAGVVPITGPFAPGRRTPIVSSGAQSDPRVRSDFPSGTGGPGPGGGK